MHRISYVHALDFWDSKNLYHWPGKGKATVTELTILGEDQEEEEGS